MIKLRGEASSSQQAFSLLELLATAALLAYSVSIILTTYNTSTALNQSSRNFTVAVSHAEYVLEDIRNTSVGAVQSAITAGNWNLDATEIEGLGLSALNTETIAVSFSGTNPFDISVTVAWKDIGGRDRSWTVKTSLSS